MFCAPAASRAWTRYRSMRPGVHYFALVAVLLAAAALWDTWTRGRMLPKRWRSQQTGTTTKKKPSSKPRAHGEKRAERKAAHAAGTPRPSSPARGHAPLPPAAATATASGRGAPESLTALVMADTRSPWPPPPSTNPRLRLLWQPSFYQRAVAMASAYARRHCYHLRVYRFTSARRSVGKFGAACTHPRLGGRAGSWCKLVALADTAAGGLPPRGSAISAQKQPPQPPQQPHAYSFIVWLDSDAFFHDVSVSIELMCALASRALPPGCRQHTHASS
jgi:hypothetical protein